MSTWLLLIYTVPSEPSRKRASVWRDLKKAGAVYLRDGVVVVPQREETLTVFRGIADKVDEFGGQSILVESAQLDAAREETIRSESRSLRNAEFEEIQREIEGFLSHVEREREHREFTFAEVEELDADLTKLKTWADQVRARDYFGTTSGSVVKTLLEQGEAELETFLDETFQQESRS